MINSTTNEVSFYPDYSFQGTRTVVFTARDAFNTTTDSNTVTLNVTPDNEPPTWSSPAKDKSDITQNTIVNFSSIWQDNIALSHYIFSIKQEGGWINQSSSSFTGLQNTSSYAIQISAPGGTNVFWRFYAFDTSGNMNSTDIQNFSVNSLPAAPSSPEEEEEEEEEDSEATKGKKSVYEKKADFSVSPLDAFKIEMKQGARESITIKITNIGNINISFKVDIKGLEGIDKIISDENFTLSPGNLKTVTIEFSSDKRLHPDIYYGKIRVITPIRTNEVPIAIIIKPLEFKFDLNVNVLEKYKKVRPNEIVKANITVENLKDIEERNFSLYYSIIDFSGKIIDSKQEAFALSSKDISLERNLSIPETIKKGEYIFFARAFSEKDIILDSDLFEIGEEFSVEGFVKTNFLFLLIFLAALIMTALVIRHHRNKERLRILNLYMMITEMKKLMKENKFEEAVSVYVRIKSAYGERVSGTALKNKEELKKEMENLSKKVSIQMLAKTKQEEPDKNPGKEKSKKETGKEKSPQSEEKESSKIPAKEENTGAKTSEENPAESSETKNEKITKKESEEIPEKEKTKKIEKEKKEEQPVIENNKKSNESKEENKKDIEKSTELNEEKNKK